jgi:hypothetical protein
MREAGLLLAGSPMLSAPICFEHAQAARNVRTQAAELTCRWLDRALGYIDEGVIRTPEDLHAERGLLAQALIATFCASA